MVAELNYRTSVLVLDHSAKVLIANQPISLSFALKVSASSISICFALLECSGVKQLGSNLLISKLLLAGLLSLVLYKQFTEEMFWVVLESSLLSRYLTLSGVTDLTNCYVPTIV